jgi:hypothetical protein
MAILMMSSVFWDVTCKPLKVVWCFGGMLSLSWGPKDKRGEKPAWRWLCLLPVSCVFLPCFILWPERWRWHVLKHWMTFSGLRGIILKLKLIYDRQSASPSRFQAPIYDPRPVFSLRFPLDSCGFVILWRPLWREGGPVIYCTIAYGHCLTLGLKSRRTHGHILLSLLRLPQPGGPGSRIYIPQEQGGPVIPPGTGLPFCHLLRLAGTTVEVF